MQLEESQNLTSKEVKAYMESGLCKRVPDLDISFMRAYELPDSRILLEIAGEGGVVHPRAEIENILRKANDTEEIVAVETTIFDGTEETQASISTEVNDRPKEISSEVLEDNNSNSLLIDGAVFEIRKVSEGNDSHALNSEYLTETLFYFSKLEFFHSYEKKDLTTLAEKIEGILENELFSSSDELTDLDILKCDRDRVWWHDSEGEVFAGNEVYVAMIEELAKVSRGYFRPYKVSEYWESDTGPVNISFLLNGNLHRIQPEYMNDWIDINIVREINRILVADQFNFEIVWTGDQMSFITMLSSSEKRKIRRERGWKFLT